MEGDDCPAPLTSFDKIKEAINVNPEIMHRMLSQLMFKQPTPIQMQSIPIINAGKDLISLAETGSGKSLAFILPILAKIKQNESGVQAVVLAPTRELAIQLYKQFLVFNPAPKKIKVKFFRAALIPYRQEDVDNFRAQTHVLITTPQKLKHASSTLDLKLDSVKTFLADEADTLFDLGFLEEVTSILDKCTNPDLQTIFFSATM